MLPATFPIDGYPRAAREVLIPPMVPRLTDVVISGDVALRDRPSSRLS